MSDEQPPVEGKVRFGNCPLWKTIQANVKRVGWPGLIAWEAPDVVERYRYTISVEGGSGDPPEAETGVVEFKAGDWVEIISDWSLFTFNSTFTEVHEFYQAIRDTSFNTEQNPLAPGDWQRFEFNNGPFLPWPIPLNTLQTRVVGSPDDKLRFLTLQERTEFNIPEVGPPPPPYDTWENVESLKYQGIAPFSGTIINEWSRRSRFDDTIDSDDQTGTLREDLRIFLFPNLHSSMWLVDWSSTSTSFTTVWGLIIGGYWANGETLPGSRYTGTITHTIELSDEFTSEELDGFVDAALAAKEWKDLNWGQAAVCSYDLLGNIVTEVTNTPSPFLFMSYTYGQFAWYSSGVKGFASRNQQNNVASRKKARVSFCGPYCIRTFNFLAGSKYPSLAVCTSGKSDGTNIDLPVPGPDDLAFRRETVLFGYCNCLP